MDFQKFSAKKFLEQKHRFFLLGKFLGANFFLLTFQIFLSPKFFFRNFRPREKIFLSELKKKLGYNFDVELSELLIYEVFRAIGAL